MPLTRYEIRLSDLHFYAYHGCMEQERRVGGDYRLDLTLRLASTPALQAAIRADDLSGTVSYADVYPHLRDEMRQPRRTLECVADSILRRLLTAFPPVEEATLTLTKVTPPCRMDHGSAAVTLCMRRE